MDHPLEELGELLSTLDELSGRLGAKYVIATEPLSDEYVSRLRCWIYTVSGREHWYFILLAINRSEILDLALPQDADLVFTVSWTATPEIKNE
jgi:hypothetical protein